MAVHKIKKKHKTAGTVWDEIENVYIGYRIDVWFEGKRYRNKTFPTRKEAEGFIAALKLEEKSLSDDELVEIFVAVREKTMSFSEFKQAIKNFER